MLSIATQNESVQNNSLQVKNKGGIQIKHKKKENYAFSIFTLEEYSYK